jgi:putative redox protein
MGVQVDTTYEGDLRCSAVHKPSSNRLLTDAPVDNMGKGESFSPTDLVGTALGTCILTTMAIVAQRNGIELRGTTIKVIKEMTAQPTRRIGKLILDFVSPLKLNDEQKQRLENAAHTCPVHRSLHPDVEIRLTFTWGK